MKSTFNESWHRVCTLKPKLRIAVNIRREILRGKKWFLFSDTANNSYFKVPENAYKFIAFLNGKNSVSEIWEKCLNEQGDDAPTQYEIINLLGQLYFNNLLQSEISPDAKAIFDKQKTKKRKERIGAISNIMFYRKHLFNPDKILEKWLGLFGHLYTKKGFAVLAILGLIGFFSVINKLPNLAYQASNAIAPQNIHYLFISFILIKIIHEFSHAFSCKYFAKKEGGYGEINSMGISLLVFMPFPFVDASSAWSLKRKSHRIIVSAAGMLIEFALAAIAAIIWANTSQGTLVHALSYNIMFVSTISTLLFNGNPLLRYDAYYILSDYLEIPNLAQRAKEFIYYLVKKYIWKIENLETPTDNNKERIILSLYYPASLIYKTIISISILFTVINNYFFFGFIAGILMIYGMVITPIIKFFEFLFTSYELNKRRVRAISSVAILFIAIFAVTSLISFPSNEYALGIIEYKNKETIFTQADGILQYALDSETKVNIGDTLIILSDKELENKKIKYELDIKTVTVNKNISMKKKDYSMAQIHSKRILTLKEQLNDVNKKLNKLKIKSKIKGIYITTDLDKYNQMNIKKGENLGFVADFNELEIKTIVNQEIAGRVLNLANEKVEIRAYDRPDIITSGIIIKQKAVGQKKLSSQALTYRAGGEIETENTADGLTAKEHFFEVTIKLNKATPLFSGQRVIVQFSLPKESLINKIWRKLLYLTQQKIYG